MSNYVHSYSRHVNGRLYTVHGYTQQDGRLNQVVNPQMIAALPGIFQTLKLVPKARYMRGTVPHGMFPKGSFVPETPQIFNEVTISKHMALGLSAGLVDEFIALAQSASADWSDAVQVGLQHVLLVMRNNPGRPMSEILARPDIQEALSEAAEKGRVAVRHDVTSTWLEQGAPTASTYLSALLDNIDNTASTFAARMTQALTSNNADAVQATVLRERYRAAAAQSVAETRAKAEALLAKAKKNGVTHVKWVAHLDARTCKYCRSLHGDVTKIGTSFDVDKLGKLKVWHDLVAPPCHPNCRCILEPCDENGKVVNNV